MDNTATVTQADKDLLKLLINAYSDQEECIDAGTCFTEEVRMLARHRTTGAANTPEREAKLAALIEQKLIGVHPDDQDIYLEDEDWRCIVAALSQEPETQAEGVAWADIASAPKDGTMILAREDHPNPKFRSKIYEGRYVTATQLSCLISGEENPRFHNRSANCWSKPTHWTTHPLSELSQPEAGEA